MKIAGAIAILLISGGTLRADDAAGLAFFEQKVRPLLVAHCYECHSAESKILQGGLLLDSKPGWQKGGDSGPVVVPGRPDESLLVRAVRYAKDEHVQMPPKGKLSDAEIAVLEQWVKLGAPDPRIEAPKIAHQRVIDIDEGKKHWAFLPLQSPQPPDVVNTWCRTPVDRFIQAKLDEAKLSANPPADPRTLIRRAYLDLIGLPPTPEEVEEFVQSGDAYEALIDKLLASPHYGERWGRHWLDLARYAESHGFEQDYDRPNAYHYRDFVIRALNDDLPYDTFVKWQIAGDEYEPENPQALMATGFLAAGVHATQITANQAEKERYDELDDMTRTIGTSMLGLTIGCARCHDHKYDPLLQADYFRMLATFTTTVRSDYDVNLDPAGHRKAVAAWEPTHRPLVEARARHERDVVAPNFEQWLDKRTASGGEPRWIVLDAPTASGPETVKFDTLSDGTIQARGSQFFALTYTVKAETALEGIVAVRLEALADDELPSGGPGTAAGGGFQIGKFKVNAAPKRKGSPVDAKIVRRTTRTTRDGKAVPAVVTENPESWTVVEGGRNQTGVFEFDKPLGFEGGTKLTFSLEFSGNHQGLGRFRLALCTAADLAQLSDAERLVGDEISEKGLVALRSLAADPKKQPSSAEREVLFAWFRTQDPQWRRLHEAEVESESRRPKPTVVKALISSEGVPAVRLHTQGPDFYDKTYVVRRGDPNQKVEEARPGFVSVLVRTDDESSWRPQPPAGSRTSYRRRGLAEWITDVDHGAGHLLARVIVNRLWYYHFGRGLVATPSDFGLQGERPSHPELLDYLAQELIRNDWRLKPIHKLIMTSAVYMQSAETDSVRQKADPDNRLFWHKPLRRLEGEIVRDAMMSVAGTLDETMFGPGSPALDQPRRSIYFFVKRSKLVPMMTLFDGPDTLQDLAIRPETTVAPQALMLLNNETIRAQAAALAERIRESSANEDVEQGVDRGYRLALGRPPAGDELRAATAFVKAQTAAYQMQGKNDGEALAWADFCQVLFGLNEFVYVK